MLVQKSTKEHSAISSFVVTVPCVHLCVPVDATSCNSKSLHVKLRLCVGGSLETCSYGRSSFWKFRLAMEVRRGNGNNEQCNVVSRPLQDVSLLMHKSVSLVEQAESGEPRRGRALLEVLSRHPFFDFSCVG